jgi:hypothetical protein
MKPEAQLPALIDEACAATLERVPFYRDKQIVPLDELHHKERHGVGLVVACF